MVGFEEDIEQCLIQLQAGGIILYPTDTLWGLGCDATNNEAVERLIALKGKPLNKGLIVLLPSERDLIRYIAAPDLEIFPFLEGFENPTTVVYEHGLGVADSVLNEDGSIAIRVVKEDFCRHLLKRFKKPIVSTSANFHGQPSPQHFKEIKDTLKNGVDYVVHFRQSDTKVARSSSIIKWVNGHVVNIRQ